MNINVDAIFEVKPKNEMRKPSSIDITASLNDIQMESLFYTLWEYVGDEGLKKWLKQEGADLIPKQEQAVGS